MAINTVTQEASRPEEAAQVAEQETSRTGFVFPAAFWRDVRKAAIDQEITAQQFVINAVTAHLLKHQEAR